MAAMTEQLLHAFRSYLFHRADDVPRRFTAYLLPAMKERDLAPNRLPCLRHLGRCHDLAPPAARALTGALLLQADSLAWGQTYTAADFERSFIDNYGWLELFGTRGHFVNDDVAAGFLVLGPNLVYPDHHHVAEEIYIPLTDGTGWRKGEGGFVTRKAGEVIHHPSNINHAMRTGDDPLLAIYLWRGGPLAQRSVIGGRDA
jgi:hypothetical protein